LQRTVLPSKTSYGSFTAIRFQFFKALKLLEVWLIFGQLVVATVGGFVAAGLWVAIGGMGAIRRAQNVADAAHADVKEVSERLSRHQKRVASHQAVEVRAEHRTLEQEAQAHLAVPPVPPGRPSVVQYLRR